MATNRKHSTQHRDNGIIDRVGQIHKRRTERDEILSHIPSSVFLSNITNMQGNNITAWAGRGQKLYGRQSTWEWPAQQIPIAWKAWKAALKYLAPDGDIGDPLGEWKSDHRQIMEWYLDVTSSALYHHVEGVWTKHDAMNIGRLRFLPEAHSCDEPNPCTHVVEVNERTLYMEIVRKYKIKET
jgi:hypothetical protein